MLDQDFCTFLEYEICKAFVNSDNDEIKGYWCDGVLLPETSPNYSKKFVKDSRKIILKAFIGKEGQTEYELILKFGNKALSRYTRSLDIKECLPNSDKSKWFDIDIKKKKIEIQLD